MADVFLSFKGQVRNIFACILFEALKTAGFQPFMDDYDVLPGDELTPKIYDAIETCKSAIVIFSKDYASSKWCLNELVLLLERRENSDTFFIIPILYGLSTDDVKIRFCKEIEQHSPKVDDLQIEKWRKALLKIGDTKARHFREFDKVTDFADGIAQRFKEIFSAKHTLPSPKTVDTSKRPIKGRSSVVNSAPKIDVPVGGLIVKEVSDFTESVRSFKSNWKHLEDTMRTISPVFDGIETINKELDRPPNQIDFFKDVKNEATDLIRRCSKINSLNILQKSNYSNKLQHFEDSLKVFFQRDVQAQQLLSIAQIAKDVRDLFHIAELLKREIIHDLSKKLDSPHGTTGSSNIFSSSSQYSGIEELPDFIVGLDFPLKDLKVMLLNHTVSVTLENKSSPMVVLLSSPPGCGKTTLANMVCHDSEIREKFKENIFFVTVSKMFNIKVIVKKIFEHKGRENELQEVQSDEDAIKKLRNLLKRLGGTDQNPILLVLDDVWSSNLKYLVDKFMFKEISGYKILVTSRNHHPGFQFVRTLKKLDHKEARELFCHNAFPQWSPQTHVLDGYVDQIVKGCKGFPLALKVVAQSLCGKDEVFWKLTLNKWSERKSSIIDSSTDLLEMLQKSLDALDDEKDTDTVLKECFLDLGSFPEDQRIPGTALMDMWAELYGLDEEDMNTYSNLLELSYRNLLDLVPTRKDDSSDYCSGVYVKQHDMLRELAIYTSSQEEIELRKRFIMEIVGERGFPQKLVENLGKPRKARLLSISTDDSFTSTWCDMQFPEVEVLVLNFRQRNYTLPNQSMKHMKKLKVLIISNYGFHPAQVQNFPEIEYLPSLRRMRLEHISISSTLGTIAFAFQLLKLKKISLSMCEISNAFNFAHLFPNLEEIEIEFCRDLVEFPAGLCHIVNLRSISITCCNELRALPEEIEGLTNLQSLRLNSCTKLKRLPEKIASLKNLSLIDVSDCIQLCEMPKRMGELKSLKKLHMRGCWEVSELPPSVEKLKNLEVFCDKPAASLWKSYNNVKVTRVKEDINLEWLHI